MSEQYGLLPAMVASTQTAFDLASVFIWSSMHDLLFILQLFFSLNTFMLRCKSPFAFIEQIFTLKRWRETMASGRSMKNLVDFHTRHKLLVLSHSPAHAKRMGKLVAEGKQMPIGEATTHYEGLLIEALRLKTTVKKNMNVLEHLLGYFKAQLSADEKQEVLEICDRYRREFVPVTLLNHYVRKFDQPYLKQQVYLNPHPVALKLRNHA
jgi:uncharacterized protein YbgA (DUF1722 family)